MKWVTFYHDLMKNEVSDLKVHNDKESALRYFNETGSKYFKMFIPLAINVLPNWCGSKIHRYYIVTAKEYEEAFDCSLGEVEEKIPCNTHFLKILPKWYEDVESGKKKFEIRRNDRPFAVGDILVLQEYERGRYTGREIQKEIEYIYTGDGTYGLSDEFCILGIKDGKTIKR